MDLDEPDLPATYLTGDAGIRGPSGGWTHLWFDVSPWAGRRVRIVLNLYQPDADDPSRVWLDNVSVGRAEPGQ